MPEFSRHAAVTLSALVSLSIAACGASGSKSPATTAKTGMSPRTSVQSKGGTATVPSGPVRGTLHATNHSRR